jgi:hypothetical protein
MFHVTNRTQPTSRTNETLHPFVFPVIVDSGESLLPRKPLWKAWINKSDDDP